MQLLEKKKGYVPQLACILGLRSLKSEYTGKAIQVQGHKRLTVYFMMKKKKKCFAVEICIGFS